MTDQQKARFYELGCVPRSLIKLREIKGQPISIDDFCNQFEKHFLNTTTEYGRIDPTAFPTVISLLGLPTTGHLSGDYSVFDREFNQNGRRLILIFSHINLNKGEMDVINHCSVLVGIDSADFAVWTCSKDGTDGVLPLTKQDWADKQCSGLILF